MRFLCGRRQVVRHQPSKLISAGSNPVARSRITTKGTRTTKKFFVASLSGVVIIFWGPRCRVSSGDPQSKKRWLNSRREPEYLVLHHCFDHIDGCEAEGKLSMEYRWTIGICRNKPGIIRKRKSWLAVLRAMKNSTLVLHRSFRFQLMIG